MNGTSRASVRYISAVGKGLSSVVKCPEFHTSDEHHLWYRYNGAWSMLQVRHGSDLPMTNIVDLTGGINSSFTGPPGSNCTCLLSALKTFDQQRVVYYLERRVGRGEIWYKTNFSGYSNTGIHWTRFNTSIMQKKKSRQFLLREFIRLTNTPDDRRIFAVDRKENQSTRLSEISRTRQHER